jgi:hypothetical protein
MGDRIDDLEKSIGDLMHQVGDQPPDLDIPSSSQSQEQPQRKSGLPPPPDSVNSSNNVSAMGNEVGKGNDQLDLNDPSSK